MAKYEVIGEGAWLDFGDDVGPRFCKVGEKITYDGWPNAAMEPVDSDAQELKEIVADYQSRGLKLPDSPQAYFDNKNGRQGPDKRDAIAIPADIFDKTKPVRLALALKLGGKKGNNVAGADKVIRAEQKRRNQAPADKAAGADNSAAQKELADLEAKIAAKKAELEQLEAGDGEGQE